MRLIKPKFEIIEQETSKGLKGVFKMIEIAGRTCYKSEENITEDSAESFVNRMIKSGHGATLEHGTVYLHLPPGSPITGYKYRDNPYSKFTRVRRTEENTPVLDTYITTNYRVIIENGWEDDLQYLCEPSIWHYKRYTVRFTCDRGVSHEFVRHRSASFAQESTRFCNYSKDKFGNELTFIIPSWCTYPEGCYLPTNSLQYGSYIWYLRQSEEAYFELLHDGWIAQQARTVLPNSLKTELVMTAFSHDWQHFFKLRCDKFAHPQARELAMPLEEEFASRGYIPKKENL